MGIVQKIQGNNFTFVELSQRIFSCVLNDGRNSQRIDVVFDIYKEHSIKSAERVGRVSKEGLLFLEVKSGHRIRNYKRLLTNTHSKNRLTKFLVQSWMEVDNRKKLGVVFPCS